MALPVLSTLAAFPALAQDKVEVRAVAQRPQISPGDQIVIAVILDHGAELHSWPEVSVPLPEGFDGMIPTTITPDGPLTPGLRLAGIQWPTPLSHQLPSPLGDGEITGPVYIGVMTAYLVFESDTSVKPGDLSISLKAKSQPCNEQTCFPPATTKLVVPIHFSPTPSDALNDPSLFAGFNQDKVTPTADSSVGAPPTPAPPNSTRPPPTLPPSPALQPMQHSFLGVSIGSGLLILFAFAVLGGAVLNLTPCVLPIIPIKVMTLVQHAGSPRHRFILGLWMALGVVIFWTAVGVPMMFVSTLDPTRLIFGNWWVTLGLGFLIAIMGLGIMGLFSINLPQAVYLINPKADTARGSFLFGIMTGVLGLPCFGFVAGGLLAGTAALPPVTVLAIFMGLGLGMAAPYLVLSINPKLVEKLPRTGAASELVKQVMGFLLLGAAAFFLTVGIKTFLARYPWFSSSMPYWAAGFFIAIASLWLIIRTFVISQKWGRRIIITVFAILPAWGTLYFAHASAQADRRDFDARQAAKAHGDGELVRGVWQEFSKTQLERARADGNTILVDFTADWCLTCKSLKRAVLDREPVRKALDSITLFEADVTLDSAPGWKHLAELGQTGVPTLVFYGPALDRPVVLNAYTSEAVLNALNQVGARPVTQR